MKKIRRRAVALLLIAALVIVGMIQYVIEYIDEGERWALFFSSANSGSTAEITDRNGIRLAYISANEQLYADSQHRRLSCYHVTGDFWGRTGTGVLTNYWNRLQGFSLITGTTQANDVHMTLTVDCKLNERAYDLMDGRKGAVMILNYKTGEVVCMVSIPAVDPADSSAEVPEGAYINRCLAAVYTPGSVFKLITAAAAIEELPNLYERQFYCEHVYEIAGVPITCSGTHWTQNFEDALANSCNIAFAQIAVKLGQETMVEHVRSYGFLDSHKLDSITSSAGTYPTDFVGDPELAWSGIGQSTDQICPYTLLRFVAAIANGGELVEPTLIIDDEEPEVTRLVKAETADELKRLMSYNVVTHYDGETRFPNLKLCAKTGTAELGDGTSHAWFTGFLDDEEHPYAFVVLVERAGGGLTNASPIANALLQELIK